MTTSTTVLGLLIGHTNAVKLSSLLDSGSTLSFYFYSVHLAHCRLVPDHLIYWPEKTGVCLCGTEFKPAVLKSAPYSIVLA